MSDRAIHISRRKRIAAAACAGVAALIRGRNRLRRPNDLSTAPVVVLEPFGLGDIISFEPLVRCLRAAGREVVLCAKPEWHALFPDQSGLVWVDTQVPWGTHNEQAKYRLRSYFQSPWRDSVRQLRQAARKGVGLDTRGDIRSVLLLQWTGCSRVLTLSTYLGSNVGIWPGAAELVPFSSRLRRWQLNLAFLEPLGIKVAPESMPGPSLAHLAKPARSAARSVAFMPVAPWRGKLWPGDRWRELARRLGQLGCQVRALCGPRQRAFAEEQVGSGMEIAECGSVESWAQELGRCGTVVTLDSGPMHLADALGVPVVALFGQGWLPFWAPSGKLSRVVAHQDDPDFTVCHPIDENIALGQKYMSLITVDEVLAAVIAIVSHVEQAGPQVDRPPLA
jgi:ADP-heptose:LPS heptosyltransferase